VYALNKKTSLYFFGFLFLLFLFHLFFLKADPNVKIAFNSVDAYTDEGLYTSQLRNFIHHGNLDVKEGDALLKAPLFNLVMAPSFFLFGTHLGVARVTVLLAGLFIIGLTFVKNLSLRPVVFIFSAIGLLQFHLFNYMQLSMADSICTLCLAAGVLFSAESFFFTADYNRGKSTFRLLIPSFLFFSAAIYLKSSFATSVLLFNIAIPFAAVFRKERDMTYKDTLRNSLLLSAASLLLYYLMWYLPHNDFFQYIMGKETAGRFAKEGEVWKTIKENYLNFFHSAELKYLMYIFYFCLIMTPFVWRRGKSQQVRYLVFCIVVWMLLEAPKLATYWVPARYLLPAVCAVALYVAVIIAELFAMGARYEYVVYHHLWKWMGIVCLTFILIMNGYFELKNFNERTFYIHHLNRVVAASLTENETMIGAWAPAFSWETKARAMPVWEGYLNDGNALNRFRPHLVAADEFLDSMFARQKTPLKEISDSSYVIDFHIRDHKAVTLYWLKKEYWK
jgi:hypothetical protein